MEERGPGACWCKCELAQPCGKQCGGLQGTKTGFSNPECPPILLRVLSLLLCFFCHPGLPAAPLVVHGTGPTAFFMFCRDLTLSVTTLFNTAILRIPSLHCFPTEHLSAVKHVKYTSYLCAAISIRTGNFSCVLFTSISPVPTAMPGTWRRLNKHLVTKRLVENLSPCPLW